MALNRRYELCKQELGREPLSFEYHGWVTHWWESFAKSMGAKHDVNVGWWGSCYSHLWATERLGSDQVQARFDDYVAAQLASHATVVPSGAGT